MGKLEHYWRVGFADGRNHVFFHPPQDREGVKQWYPEAVAASALTQAEFMKAVEEPAVVKSAAPSEGFSYGPVSPCLPPRSSR